MIIYCERLDELETAVDIRKEGDTIWYLDKDNQGYRFYISEDDWKIKIWPLIERRKEKYKFCKVDESIEAKRVFFKTVLDRSLNEDAYMLSDLSLQDRLILSLKKIDVLNKAISFLLDNVKLG